MICNFWDTLSGLSGDRETDQGLPIVKNDVAKHVKSTIVPWLNIPYHVYIAIIIITDGFIFLCLTYMGNVRCLKGHL